METINRDELNAVSMGVILHAGNAREKAYKALKLAETGNFNDVKKFLDEAKAEFVEAHHLQTDTIQKEAEGIEIPYSVLFGHAQDTLMTAKAEFSLINQMIKLYQKLEGGINHE